MDTPERYLEGDKARQQDIDDIALQVQEILRETPAVTRFARQEDTSEGGSVYFESQESTGEVHHHISFGSKRLIHPSWPSFLGIIINDSGELINITVPENVGIHDALLEADDIISLLVHGNRAVETPRDNALLLAKNFLRRLDVNTETQYSARDLAYHVSIFTTGNDTVGVSTKQTSETIDDIEVDARSYELIAITKGGLIRARSDIALRTFVGMRDPGWDQVLQFYGFDSGSSIMRVGEVYDQPEQQAPVLRNMHDLYQPTQPAVNFMNQRLSALLS